MTTEPNIRTVKSNCHYCGYLCGFNAQVEQVEPCEAYPTGEKLTDLVADDTRYPYDERITNGCYRWRMNLAEIDGPDRVNYPLKRKGGTARGAGQWERVSWDDALDDIAKRLRELANAPGNGGPQTLATAIGGPHVAYWPLHRFMNLGGSPNNMGIGQICWNIRIWMDGLTYGWPIEVNVDPRYTGQVFLWGTNPGESDNSLFWRSLLKMRKDGTPIVVVDPRETKTARIATLHLSPRPSTDCTLALAIIREIITTDRYDHDFVDKWCHGFDELTEHVQPYTLERAQEVCGVPAKDIATAARIFSEPTPTALLSGRGVDQLGCDNAPTHRALSILRAITGDVDRAGACEIMDVSDFTQEIDLEMSDAMDAGQRATQLNIGHSLLQSYPGYDGARKLTSRLGRTPQNPTGKRLPTRYLTSAHPNLVWRSVLGMPTNGEAPPYRVSALICCAANPLITYADTHLVYKALCALDLLVVLEYYMTPTAQLADYVLPIAGAFERPLWQAHGGVSNFCYGGDAAVAPYYERKTDYYFFRQLGLRLGQGEHWPCETIKDELENALAKAGMSWDQWRERGIYAGYPTFNKQDIADKDGKPQGFATTTGKIELANEYLDALGAGRLPVPATTGVADTTDSAGAAGAAGTAGAAGATIRGSAAESDGAYQLTLLTGARMQPYWASSFFNNKEFKAKRPYPTAEMSKETLSATGIRDGDWIDVSTKSGTARFMAREANMTDGVVSCEYGWWYPEDEPYEPGLSGAWRSNANLLTNADIEDCEPLIGSWRYNGIPCTVCKSHV
jgi:anaerobic selenocysteine-containing dehydrogenase